MVHAYRRSGGHRRSPKSETAREREDAKHEYDMMYKQAGELYTSLDGLRIYSEGMAERAADRGDDEAQEKWDEVSSAAEDLENAAQSFYDEATSALETIHDKTGWAKPS